MEHVAPALSARRAKRVFSTALRHQCQGRRHEWVASDLSGTSFAIVGLVKETEQAHSAEIGVVIKASHHGHGMATELLDRVMTIGFENLGLHSIGGFSTREHIASFALMNRLGFSHSTMAEIPLMEQPGFAWELTASTWKTTANRPIDGET